jgi:hypothetical protein
MPFDAPVEFWQALAKLLDQGICAISQVVLLLVLYYSLRDLRHEIRHLGETLDRLVGGSERGEK